MFIAKLQNLFQVRSDDSITKQFDWLAYLTSQSQLTNIKQQLFRIDSSVKQKF